MSRARSIIFFVFAFLLFSTNQAHAQAGGSVTGAGQNVGVEASDVIAPGGLLFGATRVRLDQQILSDAFGGSIAWYHDGTSQNPQSEWLFVGAPRERSSRDVDDGALYIYRRGDDGKFWHAATYAGFQRAASGDRFGAGVMVENGWLFVASANGVAGTNFAGAVDVYRFSPQTAQRWIHTQTLTSPRPSVDAAFGARSLSRHMAMSGNILVIGEPNVNETGAISRMYVYTLNSAGQWTLRQTIPLGTDTSQIAYNGGDSIVALHGGRFVVEVAQESPAAAPTRNQGFLHVYGRSRDRSQPLSTTPIQIIAGDVHTDQACVRTASGPIGGMAASREPSTSRLVVTDICADSPAGQRVGRMDIYRDTGARTNPLQLETSIQGTIPNGTLGASWFNGQQTVAIDRAGRQILVASSLADPYPGTDVLLYERDALGLAWRLCGRA